jgi:DNA-binding NtrC family response regulator
MGCRVGLLVIAREAHLDRLDRWEAVISGTSVCWVALVDPELTGKPQVRQFIGEHLFNFIRLPAKPDHIVLCLRHAWGMAFMRDMQRPSAVQQVDPEVALVGNTPQMQHVVKQIRKIAHMEAPVLICGPPGSGKGLAATAIHRQSARRLAPFITLNCGAVTSQVFEACLLGCTPEGRECGEQRGSPMAAAHGGTLFLDAIDELPSTMQATLERFLAEPQLERLSEGARRPRVMVASHIKLADAVQLGRFREDLYFRLNVVCLAMPPLVELGPDIEAIARHYFSRFAKLHNRSLRGFSKSAMHALLSHAWPGNVRELISRLQRATTMADGRFIQPEDLGLERGHRHGHLMSLEDARAAAERVMIQRALAHSRNQISHAAALLGISRVTLYRLIEKYNIRSQGAPAAPADVDPAPKRTSD